MLRKIPNFPSSFHLPVRSFSAIDPSICPAGSFALDHWMLASYPIGDRVLLILPLSSVFSLQPDSHTIHAKTVPHLGGCNASDLDFLAPSALPLPPTPSLAAPLHIHIIHISTTDIPNIEVSSCHALVSNLPLTPHHL